jgi:RHS repeat-associated protein
MIHLAKRSTEMQTCVVQGIFRMLKLFLLLLMLLFPAGKTLASRWDAHFTQTLGAGNTAVREFAVNDANQLTGTTTAQKFPVKLEGTTNEPSDVTVGGENAGTNTQNWTAEVLLGAGTTNVEIRATETTSIAPGTVAQTTVRKAPITLTVAPAQVLTYDGNGSTLGDGLRTYEWDAANRLRAIVTAGSPVKRTEFAYDGENRWVRIVEKEAGTVVGSREVIWEGISIAQLRLKNAAGTETERRTFHAGGEVRIAGAVTTTLLHTGDHLGSIRELVDASNGAIRARYDYDPYGKRTKLSGDLEADQGYTGHYEHAASGLTLAPFRAYDCVLGRWISRDPIEEAGGLNLYGYVRGSPIGLRDPDGKLPIVAVWLIRAGVSALVSAAADYLYDELPEGVQDVITPIKRAKDIYDQCNMVRNLGKRGFKACMNMGAAKTTATGAESALQGAQLNRHLTQLEKYGAAGSRTLENGRVRYYGNVDPARTPGEMAGRRLVREWDPSTNATRTWHETVDHAGSVRQVRPETGGPKVHYRFDANGNYIGSW